MKRIGLLVLGFVALGQFGVWGQAPRTWSSAEILQQMEKLKVLGSVLYMAAHPDDENTRLLAFLSGEEHYRTGYLSLTRGDGGQNLIGDEQGIELGLIRTQELLSARRIDGAEQFFSRAYDFGFCKTAKEALAKWDEEKILSDAVWVIRNFRPDVLITRFPPDARAGHGHHAASAVLAREAFDAAADPTRFPEQLRNGVTVWQAKRLLWNTFNFGGSNTTGVDQLKLDVGGYNAFLGKSYGEIAAESRSEHKSQGMGSTATRGQATEYFSLTAGDAAKSGLLDGVVTDWSRVGVPVLNGVIDSVIAHFDARQPSASLPGLRRIAALMPVTEETAYWGKQKRALVDQLMQACAGLWASAYVMQPYVVIGDDMDVLVTLNNRTGQAVELNGLTVWAGGQRKDSLASVALPGNKDVTVAFKWRLKAADPLQISQPYWLKAEKKVGHFVVEDPLQIGKAESDPALTVTLSLDGAPSLTIPVRYKHTDPVKGELYEPVGITPALLVEAIPSLILDNLQPAYLPAMKVMVRAMRNVDAGELSFHLRGGHDSLVIAKGAVSFQKDKSYQFELPLTKAFLQSQRGGTFSVQAVVGTGGGEARYGIGLHEIGYDHIPAIHYFYSGKTSVLGESIKVPGKHIGYINGAGDKMPVFLQLMGYEVTMLRAQDVANESLDKYDAIITGIRAFNTQDWLKNQLPKLLAYVQRGGVLLEQYNNFNGLVTSQPGPYPFSVVNQRITDETAAVTVLQDDVVLHYPNEITAKDFEGWVQERSVYEVANVDSRYKLLFRMNDPDEAPMDGSLIVANYGKGRFVYTSLSFFRQLPAGVPGAYRLMANLLAGQRK